MERGTRLSMWMCMPASESLASHLLEAPIDLESWSAAALAMFAPGSGDVLGLFSGEEVGLRVCWRGMPGVGVVGTPTLGDEDAVAVAVAAGRSGLAGGAASDTSGAFAFVLSVAFAAEGGSRSLLGGFVGEAAARSDAAAASLSERAMGPGGVEGALPAPAAAGGGRPAAAVDRDRHVSEAAGAVEQRDTGKAAEDLAAAAACIAASGFGGGADEEEAVAEEEEEAASAAAAGAEEEDDAAGTGAAPRGVDSSLRLSFLGGWPCT